MPFLGLTGHRRELRPTRQHVFTFFIVFFSILVPPIAVAMRFGIGTDFFTNVVLTALGYIPGHVHNFFIQRIRSNSSPKRMPKWLRRYGLVADPRQSPGYQNTMWANRYVNATHPVQYDDDGRAYYIGDDGEELSELPSVRSRAGVAAEDGAETPTSDALVDPDRFLNDDGSASQRGRSSRASVVSEREYGMEMDTVSRTSVKSLKARTLRFFGAGQATPPAGVDRHTRIGNALGRDELDPVQQRRHNVGYHIYDDDDDDDECARPEADAYSPRDIEAPDDRRAAPPATRDAALDDLDRELMGLSAQDYVPPVRGSRLTPRDHVSPRRAARVPPPRPDPPPQQDLDRDIMDYQHNF
ncbi:hypothetical protein MSPP1_002412 [Malassezia sp. CBS 17886]|nr:hypothetical protein MSPP1_002412 [Malassezia sp. CBS 17886]